MTNGKVNRDTMCKERNRWHIQMCLWGVAVYLSRKLIGNTYRKKETKIYFDDEAKSNIKKRRHHINNSVRNLERKQS